MADPDYAPFGKIREESGCDNTAFMIELMLTISGTHGDRTVRTAGSAQRRRLSGDAFGVRFDPIGDGPQHRLQGQRHLCRGVLDARRNLVVLRASRETIALEFAQLSGTAVVLAVESPRSSLNSSI